MAIDSMIVDIADAIVAKLNAEVFFIPFVAERKYAPILDLKELSDLHVTVVPMTSKQDVATRGMSLVDESIDVAVQQKVTAIEGEPVDLLMKLSNEINRFLRNLDVEIQDAQWLRVEPEPIYDVAMLREKRAFTGVLTTTYKASVLAGPLVPSGFYEMKDTDGNILEDTDGNVMGTTIL